MEIVIDISKRLRSAHASTRQLIRLCIGLATFIFFFAGTELKADTAEYARVYSAVKWQNYLLMTCSSSVCCALDTSAKSPELIPTDPRPYDCILSAAADPNNKFLVSLVQGKKHQYLKIKTKTSADEILNLPPILETEKAQDRWLFIMENKIHVVRRNNRQFVHAILNKRQWFTQTLESSVPIAGWWSKNFKQRVFLNKNGLYCLTRCGEWGTDVQYFNFRTKKWSTVFGYNLNTSRQFMVVESDTNKSIWLVSDQDIREIVDGKTLSLLSTSDLRTPFHGWSGAYVDSLNNLYLSDNRGNVFELSGKSLVPVTNYEIRAKDIDKTSNIDLVYATDKLVLLSADNNRLVLFDRQTNKSEELTLGSESLKL